MAIETVEVIILGGRKVKFAKPINKCFSIDDSDKKEDIHDEYEPNNALKNYQECFKKVSFII